jgi:hypothetical protein
MLIGERCSRRIETHTFELVCIAFETTTSGVVSYRDGDFSQVAGAISGALKTSFAGGTVHPLRPRVSSLSRARIRTRPSSQYAD